MSKALPVLYERHGEQVAVITLNRPEKKNAINLQMAELIRTYLRQADNDDSVRAIVLAGQPAVFSAGMDVDAFRQGELPIVTPEGFGGLIHAQIAKVIIAAVDGIAYGGGFELALAWRSDRRRPERALQFPRNRARVSRRTRWMRALAGAHFPLCRTRLAADRQNRRRTGGAVTRRHFPYQRGGGPRRGAAHRRTDRRKRSCRQPNGEGHRAPGAGTARSPLIRFSTRPGRAPAPGCRPPIILPPVRLNRHFPLFRHRSFYAARLSAPGYTAVALMR